MNDQIKQIAERLRGLRDVLELTSEDIARDSDISAEEYRLAETCLLYTSYIESWGNKQYVATSGLIVHPDFRGLGLAKRIKQASFQLARLRRSS